MAGQSPCCSKHRLASSLSWVLLSSQILLSFPALIITNQNITDLMHVVMHVTLFLGVFWNEISGIGETKVSSNNVIMVVMLF